jgi:hypothetical protein
MNDAERSVSEFILELTPAPGALAGLWSQRDKRTGRLPAASSTAADSGDPLYRPAAVGCRGLSDAVARGAASCAAPRAGKARINPAKNNQAGDFKGRCTAEAGMGVVLRRDRRSRVNAARKTMLGEGVVVLVEAHAERHGRQG